MSQPTNNPVPQVPAFRFSGRVMLILAVLLAAICAAVIATDHFSPRRAPTTGAQP